LYVGRFCSAFDLAALVLLGCAAWLALMWTENFGGGSSDAGVGERAREDEDDDDAPHKSTGMRYALAILQTNRSVSAVGWIIALFESSMFIFVFLWTPAITQDSAIQNAPYGLIFALFMMGCMLGSCIYSLLTARGWDAVDLLTAVFALSAASHSVAVFTTSPVLLLASFVLFELCVGVYLPTMGMLKSKVRILKSPLYSVFL
jgi:MFS transporter, MFS domain-containing protein family, molybdate-anion transporter